MNVLQRLKLWWLTASAKSAYATWYSYSYGYPNDNYCHKRDGKLSDRSMRAERRMNEYRTRLGLAPLWPYLGRWTPADGRTTGLNACSMTSEQYWAQAAAIDRRFDS